MIVLGCDRAGKVLLDAIKLFLDQKNLHYEDLTVNTPDADYPDTAKAVAKAVAADTCNIGILCCGTGIGMSIAANKVNGIRAAVLSDYYSAKYTRLHNDANILCMGGRVIGPESACLLAETFIETPFEAGRHSARIQKITDLEQQ